MYVFTIISDCYVRVTVWRKQRSIFLEANRMVTFSIKIGIRNNTECVRIP